MLEEEDEEENMDTPLVESDGIDGAVGDIGGGGRVVLEVVVGVLTAFTLLLLCLFLGLLFAYSRRQKTGGGDSSSSCRRSLNPFPAAAQVNMKDLLLTLSPSGHHGLASLAQQQQQQPNTSSSSSGAPSASSSSSSSNKANITPNPGYYSFAAPDAGEGPPLLLTRLQQQHQQEQKEHLFLQQQQQRHFSEEARARWHSTGNVDGLFDLEDEVGAAMPPSIVVADLLEGGGGGGGFGGVAEYACVDVQVKKLRR